MEQQMSPGTIMFFVITWLVVSIFVLSFFAKLLNSLDIWLEERRVYKGIVARQKARFNYKDGDIPADKKTSYNDYVPPATTTPPPPPVKKAICPPRANFFGRIEGQPVVSIGNYEERFLGTWDLYDWKKQKERKEALEKGILDEKPKVRILDRWKTTKTPEEDFFDNFYGQNS